MASKPKFQFFDAAGAAIHSATARLLGPYPGTGTITVSEIGTTGVYAPASTPSEGLYQVQRDAGAGFVTEFWHHEMGENFAKHMTGHGTASTAGKIGSTDLADDAVTGPKIADDAVGQDHLDAVLTETFAAQAAGLRVQAINKSQDIGDYDNTYKTIPFTLDASMSGYVGMPNGSGAHEEISGLMMIVDVDSGQWTQALDSGGVPITVVGAYSDVQATAAVFGFQSDIYLKLSAKPDCLAFMVLFQRKALSATILNNGRVNYEPPILDTEASSRLCFVLPPINSNLDGRYRLRIQMKGYDVDGHLYMNETEIEPSFVNSGAGFEEFVLSVTAADMKDDGQNYLYITHTGNSGTPEVRLVELAADAECLSRRVRYITSNTDTLGAETTVNWDGTAGGNLTLSSTMLAKAPFYIVHNVDSTYAVDLTPNGGKTINGTSKITINAGKIGVAYPDKTGSNWVGYTW